MGIPVPMTIALPPPEDRAFADVWSALGGELKPSLDIVVSAPVETGQTLRGRPAGHGAAAAVDRGRRRLAAARAGRRRRLPAPTGQPAASRGPVSGCRSSGGGRRGRSRDGRGAGTASASLGYLLGRASLTEDRVRALVEQRRADDPAPDDPFRGLYVNDETVDRLLAGAREPPTWADDERLAVEAAGRRRRGGGRGGAAAAAGRGTRG